MAAPRLREALRAAPLLVCLAIGCGGDPRPLPGSGRNDPAPATQRPEKPEGAVETKPSDVLGEWEAELWRVDYDAPWLPPDEATRHREFIVSRPEMRLTGNRPIPDEPDKLLVRLTVRGEALPFASFEFTHESPDLDESNSRKIHGQPEQLDDGRLLLDAIHDEFVLAKLENGRLHVAADLESIGGDLSQRRPFDFEMMRAEGEEPGGDEPTPENAD